MSAFPEPEIYVPIVRAKGLSHMQYCAIAITLAVVGLATIWPSVIALWSLWTTNALKSIGMVIPVVSLVLILRAWRKLEWATEGTWWGLAFLLITTVVSRIQQQG